MTNDDDFLADRVDYEPNVFKGISSPEFFSLVKLACAVLIPVTLITLVITRSVLALVFLPVGVVLTVYVGAAVLTAQKRGRPQGYYVHLIQRGLARVKLSKGNFIIRSGRWMLSRKDPY